MNSIMKVDEYVETGATSPTISRDLREFPGVTENSPRPKQTKQKILSSSLSCTYYEGPKKHPFFNRSVMEKNEVVRKPSREERTSLLVKYPAMSYRGNYPLTERFPLLRDPFSQSSDRQFPQPKIDIDVGAVDTDELVTTAMPLRHWIDGDPAFKKYYGGPIVLSVPRLVKRNGTPFEMKRLGTLKEPIILEEDIE